MKEIDNGGSAFPETRTKKHYVTDVDVHSAGGMSLRDYFAASAATGLCSNQKWMNNATQVTGLEADQVVALASYEMADAMLAARNKEPQQ